MCPQAHSSGFTPLGRYQLPRKAAPHTKTERDELQLSVMFGGVHGVYVVLVLAVAAAVRSVTHNMRLFIPFDDLPCTVRLRALCHDIYAMRLAGELRLEEELFFTLIRIYRTPTVLFEFTKRREEQASDEGDVAAATEITM